MSDEQHHVAPEGAQRLGCFICRPDDTDAPDEGCSECEDRWIRYVTQRGF